MSTEIQQLAEQTQRNTTDIATLIQVSKDTSESVGRIGVKVDQIAETSGRTNWRILMPVISMIMAMSVTIGGIGWHVGKLYTDLKHELVVQRINLIHERNN